MHNDTGINLELITLSEFWEEEYFDGLAQTAKYNGSVGCQVEDENKPWSVATSQ